MAASTACPNCGSETVRHSQWRRKDGVLRLLFFSTWRCQTCRHRSHRVSLWGAAAILGAVLVMSSCVGVVYIISR
jgi:predicted RNA-binding Zn-ribbon protein involved in translation (DUF1610 family)